MQGMSRLTVLILIVAALMFGPGLFRATAPAQDAQTEDVTRVLAGELRQLRIAIENLAAANSRVQLLAMRAGQQEERLARLSEQLLTARTRLAEEQGETARIEGDLNRLEESLRVETDPALRREVQVQQRQLLVQHDNSERRQGALLAQVEQLNRQALIEQDRLSDFDRRLEELDRLLTVRQ